MRQIVEIGGRRAGDGRMLCLVRPVDQLRQRIDTRVFVEVGQRDKDPELFVDAPKNHVSLQGVPAEFEEVIVEADLVDTKVGSPDAAQGPLGLGLRSTVGRSTIGARVGSDWRRHVLHLNR